MKKIKTLKMNYEFKNVFNKGKYYIGRQIIGYSMKNKRDFNRLGIAINTKLCHAVYRNKLKRKIRAAYQDLEFDCEKGYDLVFIWNKKTNISEMSYDVIYSDMKKMFLKMGIMK